MVSVKQRYGVPSRQTGCHTGLVGGYVVEGHVPAPDIARMLAGRPRIVGLAVPGMPLGSPGMESLYQPPVPYDVFAFDAGGATTVFASY
jgi:hypothetical protein